MFERSCDNYNAYFDQLWHMLFWVTTSGIGHLFTLVLLKYNSVRGYHCSFDNMRRVKKKQKMWFLSTCGMFQLSRPLFAYLLQYYIFLYFLQTFHTWVVKCVRTRSQPVMRSPRLTIIHRRHFVLSFPKPLNLFRTCHQRGGESD